MFSPLPGTGLLRRQETRGQDRMAQFPLNMKYSRPDSGVNDGPPRSSPAKDRQCYIREKVSGSEQVAGMMPRNRSRQTQRRIVGPLFVWQVRRKKESAMYPRRAAPSGPSCQVPLPGPAGFDCLRQASRMMSTGTSRPSHIARAFAPCWTSISRPSTMTAPLSRALLRNKVGLGE